MNTIGYRNFTGGVMFASADKPRFEIEAGGVDAFRGVTVTLATTSDGEIRNGIIIGFENFRITEHFVAKGVQSE